ncbi:hypothetical protein AAFF_G00263740 [Aldrovandia affinis]|uniref:SAM domain-containing protein n=1 Tax=Aldrovandia affinis TaxID=143900 RepID=A0AAD7WST7_9TELE|nr:hypothetical protein AAFF_G00263740 [Aldrovandia affinis]
MSCELLESDGGSGQDEGDFSWDDFLEENGVLAVPHHAFKHVDLSLQTGLSPGMKLEVQVREPDGGHWLATIITTCGQLLLLRYEGYQHDRRADFWCDIMTADLHPVGWSRQQGRPMKPLKAFGRSMKTGKLSWRRPCQRLVVRLPTCWRGRTEGRILWTCWLRVRVWSCSTLRTQGRPGRRRWVFYLHPLLHPTGWARAHGCTLAPPAALQGLRSEAEWDEVRQGFSTQPEDGAITEDLFKDRPAISAHCFTEGMKLEAVDPSSPFSISPATVTKVFSDTFFLVEMDDLRGGKVGAGGGPSILCHRGNTGILPVQWSLKNGVQLSPPPGYQGQDFDWADYLKQCGAEAAPQHCFPTEECDHGFVESTMLEAVNPLSPEHIHVAAVTKVRGQHIWLRLEGVKQSVPELVVHVRSMDIFPIGWCETNGYSLQHPSKPRVQKQRRVAVVQPEKHRAPPRVPPPDTLKQQENGQSESGQGNGKYCCPKIYFNHRCFSGPYLNKGRIAELPQCIGPGNCVLVLKEVLTLLINAAYKPSRVLRELQLDEEARWQGHGETLKAKYKGKSYRATVEIVRTAERVAEFCRKTCIRLECCPNLFGPRMVLDRCSENCSVLTKTKYTHYYGKKKSKRIGRPPGGHTNLEGGVKRAGKRRKRRKHFFVHKKKRSASLDNTPAGSPQESGEEEDLDEDDSLSEDTGSELQDELLDDSEQSERKSQPPSPTPTETARHPRRRKTHSPSYSDNENRPPSPKRARGEAPEKLLLDSSPLEWSVADVARFIRTTDCAPLARIFMDQEIDGQALLLLTLPTVQECMGLKLGPAIKLCHHIERVKLAFYQQFAS